MQDKLIKIAEAELGTCEPSGDDKYIKYYNNLTGAKFATTVAWCAIFVTYCKAVAGIGTDIIPHFASCDVGKQWFEKKSQYKPAKAYGGTYTPTKGDIIFFSSKYTQKDSTHVGIVTNTSGTKVNTIEGNTSDKVARRSYDLSSKSIIGYGVPAYNGSTITTSATTTMGGNIVNIKLPILKSGTKNGYVKTLQQLLLADGYDLGSYGVDGNFGSKTLSAVKSYQTANKLTPDGIVGEKTWASILKND